jgi:hypothetical protein
MKFSKSELGKIYKITDVMKGIPCKNCNSCVRIRLMEMGLVAGEKIKLLDYKFGLWTVNILSDSGNIVSSIALRDEEIERVCIL